MKTVLCVKNRPKSIFLKSNPFIAFSLFSFILFCIQLSTQAQYNFYYGNIHAHTEYSDGNKDSLTSGVNNPGESYAYAKGSYHFDFLGISEHNHFSSTNNPGMLLPRYAAGLYEADTANQNGTFVAMYGLEFGTISQGGHIVAYGAKGLIGWETLSGSPNYSIYCPLNNFTTFWNIIDTIPNAFCTLAHPQTGDYGNLLGNIPFNATADKVIVGTAVRSGSAFSTTIDYTDAPATSYETEYRIALSKGYHVGPTIDHDNHYTTFGRTNPGRTVVLANALHRDSLVAAYRARRFYASDDWNAEVNFTINGHFMGAIDTTYFDPVLTASINDVDPTDAVSNIKIYYGVPGSGLLPSILYQVNNTNVLNYPHSIPPNTSYYYYLKITQTDGDIIWTAPIWLYRAENPLPLSITSFDAYAHQGEVDIHFDIAHVEGVNEISIAHSVNSYEFNHLISFPLSSSFEHSFTYTHAHPQAGPNYYRLRYTDLDGKVNYSPIQTVYIDKPADAFSIFPNPASDAVCLSYTSATSTKAIVKIYNQEGREVLFQQVSISPGENKLVLAISSLGAGRYYLVLQKNNQRMVDASFVKQ